MPLPFSLSDAVAASALSTGTLTVLAYLLFPRLKEMVRKFVGTELKKIEQLDEGFESHTQQLERHDDELRWLREAVVAQGTEMKQLPNIAESMRASAVASQEMARTMREIHDEVKDHTVRLARWDGYMEASGWDGRERRGHGRRGVDHEG